ncbi:hypothetical protein [Thalassotalea piscium]|uniref:DNA-binding protein n=1 Tax=Thalassotalea piscium TaxID=1230533 RepID=A0A7X0NKJ1_9GAMM|nr:hypothetical protein [Thalassotalea piscium]MBB6545081.1 hypothetical protein [Thalassotalea piscium]
MSETEKQELAKALEADLLKLHGSSILTLKQLHRALNYRSVDAVKQAILRGVFPVHTFEMPHRRGKFALIKDVAQFLAEQAFNEEKKDV